MKKIFLSLAIFFSIVTYAYAATIFTDTFTGTNGTSITTYDSVWEGWAGSADIQSNALRLNGAFKYEAYAQADICTKVTVTYLPSTYVAVHTRHTASVSQFAYFQVNNSANTWTMGFSAGSGSSGSTTVPSVPFELKMCSDGDSHTGYINGSLIATVSNSSVPSAGWGAISAAGGTNTVVDDFIVEDVTPDPTPTPTPTPSPTPPPTPAPDPWDDPNTCTGWLPFNGNHGNNSGYEGYRTTYADGVYTNSVSVTAQSYCKLANVEEPNCRFSGMDFYSNMTSYPKSEFNYVKYRIKFDPTSTITQFRYRTAANWPDIHDVSVDIDDYNYYVKTDFTSDLEPFRPVFQVSNIQSGETLKIDSIEYNVCTTDVTDPPIGEPIDQEYNPFFSIYSSYIEEVLGWARLTVTGNTDYYSDSAVCRVLINHNVAREGGGSYTTSGVSTIELDAANPVPDTQELSDTLGNSVYLGVWNSGSISSEWVASDVLVPYDASGENTYTATFQCTDGDETIYNYQSLSPSDPGYINPQPQDPLLPEDETPLIVEDCDDFDIVCKLTTWGWQFIRWQSDDENKYNELKQELSEKAPFAYVNAIYDTSFSDVDPDGSNVTFEMELAGELYEWDFTQPIGGVEPLEVVKDVFRFFIYLIFMFYVISVARNFFSMGQ